MVNPKADIFIQAGHEGRRSGVTGAVGRYGREIDWTPIVADRATELLREKGVSVIREDAALDGFYEVQIAVFLHFDGSDAPCASGASVGYDDPSDKPYAAAWKRFYGQYWPFRWMNDNFTANLRGYYGFGHTITSKAEFVVEFGEITCDDQALWLKPRLQWLGDLLAEFLSLCLAPGTVIDRIAAIPAVPTAALVSTHFTASGGVRIPDVYLGIDLDEFKIPRKGLSNPTLQKELHMPVEPLGDVVTYLDMPFVAGKVSHFGGPADIMDRDSKTGLTQELSRDLRYDDYYCAMRWNYMEWKDFWKNRRILVVNPQNSRAVVARAIDWGPHPSTRRILDVSEKTLDKLHAATDDTLLVAFVNERGSTLLGPLDM